MRNRIRTTLLQQQVYRSRRTHPSAPQAAAIKNGDNHSEEDTGTWFDQWRALNAQTSNVTVTSSDSTDSDNSSSSSTPTL